MKIEKKMKSLESFGANEWKKFQPTNASAIFLFEYIASCSFSTSKSLSLSLWEHSVNPRDCAFDWKSSNLD